MQVLLPHYFYKRPRNRMSKKNQQQTKLKTTKEAHKNYLFFFHNSFKCSVLKCSSGQSRGQALSEKFLWRDLRKYSETCGVIGGWREMQKGHWGNQRGGRCHQKGVELQQWQVVHVVKRECAGLPTGCQSGVEGKGCEERSLDLDEQSFIGDFRLNSGHLFSKCQGYIYLI